MTAQTKLKNWVEVQDSPGMYVRKPGAGAQGKSTITPDAQRRIDAAIKDFQQGIKVVTDELRRRRG